jgi:hypothetical protein
MAFFSGLRAKDGEPTTRDRHGDAALDVLIILLLVAFTAGTSLIYGAARPMMHETNPGLMAHPEIASEAYAATPVAYAEPAGETR